MHDLNQTRALLKRLRKELNGKLKCSAETEREIDLLIADIEKAHGRRYRKPGKDFSESAVL